MGKTLWRAYVLELVGTFALVFFGAGVVCVQHLTTPTGQPVGTSPLYGHQPGLVGIALAQGLILAVVLAATMHVSGGYVNPAITIMLWVFNRLESARAAWLIGAQLTGAVLAGLCLRCTFVEKVLHDARLGTPHLNPDAYGSVDYGSLASGTAVELVLTFFLVFAIFGSILDKASWRPGAQRADTAAEAQEGRLRTFDGRLAGLLAGLLLTAGALFAYPLTGAAANPARWFGTAFWEWTSPRASEGSPGPLADMFVYIAGPILGALLSGTMYFFVLLPAQQELLGIVEMSGRADEPARTAAQIRSKR